MALDGGFRCNDQRLGAMNHAPTKNLPLVGEESAGQARIPALIPCT